MRRILWLTVLLVLVFGACAQEDGDEAGGEAGAEIESVDVEASDYKFAAEATVESGEVEFNLSNSGKEPHQAQLFRLNDGVELQQVIDEGKKPEAERDLTKLGEYAGGPNAVDAGESQVSVAQLETGSYAFICQVPDAQGRAHLGLGMAKDLEVTRADEEAEAPEADYSSSAQEFSFVLPETWDGTVSFENTGEQPHELQVIGVAEGKTPEDVEAWFKAEPGTAGPPSWNTGGGIAVIQPGQTGSFEAELEPGTYFAMCFVPDTSKEGAPHFALGMMQRFQVE